MHRLAHIRPPGSDRHAWSVSSPPLPTVRPRDSEGSGNGGLACRVRRLHCVIAQLGFLSLVGASEAARPVRRCGPPGRPTPQIYVTIVSFPPLPTARRRDSDGSWKHLDRSLTWVGRLLPAMYTTYLHTYIYIYILVHASEPIRF